MKGHKAYAAICSLFSLVERDNVLQIADVFSEAGVFFCPYCYCCTIEIQKFRLERFVQRYLRGFKGIAPFAIGCEDITVTSAKRINSYNLSWP